MLNYEILEKLTRTIGVSGEEDDVRSVILSEIEPYADEIHISPLGNILAFKKGEKRPEKKLMLCAHMDEVGFIITNITENGLLKFTTVGNIRPEVLSGRDVLVGGKRMNGLPPFKRNTPLVFQEYALFPHMTVYENISYGLKLNKTPKEEMDRRVQEMLNMFNLTGLEKRFPKEMSGGQQQRVAFARALVMGQEILLLDEPFSALDYLTRVEMQEWLLEQWEHYHKTILFITHDVEEAVFLSKKIFVIQDRPFSSMEMVEVPLPAHRDRNDLKKPEIVDLKERLIGKLRRSVRL